MKRITRPKARELIVQTWQSQANLVLFLGLLVVAVFVLPALTTERRRVEFFSNIVYSFVLATGVAIAWGQRKLFALAAGVGILAISVRWFSWVAPSARSQVLTEALSLLSVLVIASVVLAQVFRAGPINAMRVQGAVATYLLLGVAYAFAFQIDAHFNPTAIASSEGAMVLFRDWMYYSFCTLSTLGYGDIVPTGRVTRSLAIAEAISGQLYLAVLIARLVAMQVSSRDASDHTRQG